MLVTAKQLSEIVQLSRTAILRMARDKRIPGFKISNQAGWRFDYDEVIHALENKPLDKESPEE